MALIKSYTHGISASGEARVGLAVRDRRFSSYFTERFSPPSLLSSMEEQVATWDRKS